MMDDWGEPKIGHVMRCIPMQNGPSAACMAAAAPALQSVMVSAASGPHRSSLAVAARWASVARLWWRSSDRKRAWKYVVACAIFSLANVGLLLWISYAQNALQSSLSEKQAEGFYAAVRDFVLIIIIAAPFFALVDYVDSCMTVAWRNWLTQHMLRTYFANHAYFKLKLDPQAIDNPDQRICEDVRAFCATSVSLAVSIGRKVINCIAFAGLLWSLAPRLAIFLIFYAVGGTWVTASGFGRRLMHLTYSVLQREADLRFALVRVRENAESIAFYSGDQREQELAGSRLAAVIATIFGKVRWEAYLSFWQNAYSYATILLPSLLLHKRYFAGEIRFGDISQASFAFNTIEGALSYIINHLSEISQLAAQTDRLDALLTTLVAQHEGVPGGVRRIPSSDGSVGLVKLTLATPHGEMTVCRDLSFTLSPGQSLLIVGPSGVGKTSIMRAVAGLWSAGTGAISAPSDTFFLPQRPYMPLGTLRDQLTFPDSYATVSRHTSQRGSGSNGSSSEGAHTRRRSSDGGSGDDEGAELLGSGNGSTGARRLAILRATASGSYRGAGSSRGEAGSMAASGGGLPGLGPGGGPAQDEELQSLLDAVMLPKLLARVGGLDAEADWAHMLSLGEQQRVSIARLLHHQPAVAFLDEATSALDVDTEQALYARLQAHCKCFISIAHRKQLAAFHTHVLEAQGDGQWVLHDAPDFLKRLKD